MTLKHANKATRSKRGDDREEPAPHGMVTGAVNQYVRNGETDPTASANREGLTSHEAAGASYFILFYYLLDNHLNPAIVWSTSINAKERKV